PQSPPGPGGRGARDRRDSRRQEGASQGMAGRWGFGDGAISLRERDRSTPFAESSPGDRIRRSSGIRRKSLNRRIAESGGRQRAGERAGSGNRSERLANGGPAFPIGPDCQRRVPTSRPWVPATLAGGQGA